jgi:NAD(P)-dependent dehydrogenase (short-subunit alcohol dehydrogenase family)
VGDRLADRVAIVTGAGMGIGRGIARRFAREGCRVAIAETQAEYGERAAAEINAEFGARARFLHVDVGRRDEVERMVEATVESEGRLDILVNNAQGYTPLVPLEERPTTCLPDRWTPGSGPRSGRCKPRSLTCVSSTSAGSSTSAH